MAKWWSVLFGVVLFACGASVLLAPLMGVWLPAGLSTHAWDVDKLFYIILGITAFFYLLTEGLLVWFMWRFVGVKDLPKPDDAMPGTASPELPETLQPTWFGRLMRPVNRVLYDQHRVEMAWTLVPAVILLYIAFAQIGAWARIKYQSHRPGGEREESAMQVEVIAHQFGWRVRYPNPDRLGEWRKGDWKASEGKDSPVKIDYHSFSRVPQMSDVVLINELHTWVGQPIVVSLSTRDVIHSFNLPHMRVKQDALPGRMIPVWFTPTASNTRLNPMTKQYEDGYNHETGRHDPLYIWDLACAELCGWGHYRMIGRLYVHKDYNEFQNWLRKAAENQARSKS